MSDETKSKQVMARMTPATAERLEQIAAEMDRSVSWLLNDLAVKFIAAQGKPAKRKTKPQE